jgi:hypothetical protein
MGPDQAFEDPEGGNGGCGCEAARSHGGGRGLLVLGLGLMLFLRRRALLGLFFLIGCGSFDGSDEVGDGRRLVVGALVPPGEDVLGRQQVALELVAASLDARGAEPITLFAKGVPFSPSANGGRPVRFRLAIPADQSVSLFFQTPIEGAGGIGAMLAPVRFSAGGARSLTDILPGRKSPSAVALPDLDLGTVAIELATSASVNCGEAACSPTFQVTLGDGASLNPLASTDADGDGSADLADSDDDGDLIPDEIDPDADGNDVPDQFQSFDSLADGDANGVPDRFQAIQ